MESNLKLDPPIQNRPTKDKSSYPLSPTVKVINDFSSNESEYITLVHEGNGTYSVPSAGTSMKNDDQQMENIFEENKENEANATEEEAFRSEEDTSALSKQEITGSVRERLSKETPSGKSISIIVSSSTKKIFSNPTTTRKMLDNSNFRKYMIGPIEVRGRGNSIKLEVKSEIESDLGLKNIRQLANFPVRVWCPMTTQIRPKNKVGVISPVDLDTNLQEEFIPYLKLTDKDVNNCKILEAKRLNRRGRDLELVKVVFEGDFLPEKVIWNNLIYKVRPYIFSPLRCYKCQGYGHGASSCTGRNVCSYCSKYHKFEDCLQDDDVICCHCRLDHFTGDRCCEFYKAAANIEDLKQKGEITYLESKRRYNSLNNKTLDQLLNNSNGDNNRGYSTGNVKNEQTKHEMKAVNIPNKNNLKANITTNNRFDVLADETNNDSDDSDCDFFDVMNTLTQSRKLKSRNKRNICKNASKTYANAVKSYLNENSDEEETILSNNTLGDNKSSQTDHSTNHDIKENKLTTENNTSYRNKANKQGSDYYTKEFKETFFYQLLNKVKRFTQNTPIKSLEFWFRFMIELFDFVGQQFEDTEQ